MVSRAKLLHGVTLVCGQGTRVKVGELLHHEGVGVLRAKDST